VWGLVQDRFQTPKAFFRGHYITNFCPLVFMADTGRNLTPDKLPVAEREPLVEACRIHLRRVLEILKPQYLIGVGVWAEQQARACVQEADGITVGRILHPSPASPAANRDWAGQATRQLIDLGVWEDHARRE
jgi:single-strand selective monofunctional uracil DNA glycosylase